MITFIVFCCLSLLTCILAAQFLLEPGWQYLWLPLLYLLCFFACAAVFIVVMCLSALFVSKKKTYHRPSAFYHWVQMRIIELLCILCLVRVRVKGKENIPSEGVFYLVGNHLSLFDPMLESMILKDKPFAFISKPENFKIPFIGRILHRNFYLPIDRENNRNALLTMTKAIEMLTKWGYSIGIYPEGHRNKNKVDLLPFHAGSFRVPLKAKVPVLLAVIDGAELISQRKFWHPVTVDIRFIALVDTQAYSDTQALSDHCRQLIQDDLQKHAAR